MTVKSKVKILQHFVAFSESMNFNALVPKENYKPSTGPPERTGTPGLVQSPFGQVLFNRRKKPVPLNFLGKMALFNANRKNTARF